MIYVITGTDTDVGKTVATAALVARELAQGRSVAVYKPTQTGVDAAEPGDAQNIASWLGEPARLSIAEGVRLREPMAPVDAALVAGGQAAIDALPTLDEHRERIRRLALDHDTVFVEGAGGLLVTLCAAGANIADLAAAVEARLVVITRPDLGTLNHTALTLEAAVNRGFNRGTLLLGSYPENPTVLHHRNLGNLRALAGHHGWHFAGALSASIASGNPKERLVNATLALSFEQASACI
ncbi:dethiobiotin synthase [Glutamicibacter sp.]|uniref:dethiobiotin synthase n=1 Tax=Glutamicibacter sp. TaxID=1931995 RepID=UPI0028BD81E4|nr:dethiobiotin synthase [Glutamicibacter sp.]